MLNRQLWRHGPFTRFWIGATLSDIGGWFNTVAVAVLIYHITKQVALVSAGVAFQVAPRIFLNPIAGVLADRFDRKNLLFALDVFSFPCALVPLVGFFWPAWIAVPLTYLAVFLLQAASSLYWPTQDAYATTIVPSELLPAANVATNVSVSSAIFVGPALGALFVGLWGPGVSFVLNAGSFLVSAGILYTLPHSQRTLSTVPSVSVLLKGYRTIVEQHPRLVTLYVVRLAGVVPIFYFQGIAVAYARSLGQSSAFIGVLYAAAGAGGVLGAMALQQIQRRFPPVAIAALFPLGGPLLGLLALVTQSWLALIVLAASTVAGGATEIIVKLRIQRAIAEAELGRAFGMLRFFIAVGQLVGASLGILTARTAAVSSLLWVGIGVVPVMILGLVLSRGATVAQSEASVVPTPEPDHEVDLVGDKVELG